MGKKIERSYRYGLFIRGGWAEIPEGYTLVPNFISRHYAKVLTPSKRDIIDCLFRHQKEDASAICNPSIPTIVNETGYSYRQIRDDLLDMEKEGFLKIKRQFGKNNEYNYQPFIDYMQDLEGLNMREPITPEDVKNQNLARNPKTLT